MSAARQLRLGAKLGVELARVLDETASRGFAEDLRPIPIHRAVARAALGLLRQKLLRSPGSVSLGDDESLALAIWACAVRTSPQRAEWHEIAGKALEGLFPGGVPRP